jgi:hypothetical protein
MLMIMAMVLTVLRRFHSSRSSCGANLGRKNLLNKFAGVPEHCAAQGHDRSLEEG